MSASSASDEEGLDEPATPIRSSSPELHGDLQHSAANSEFGSGSLSSPHSVDSVVLDDGFDEGGSDEADAISGSVSRVSDSAAGAVSPDIFLRSNVA